MTAQQPPDLECLCSHPRSHHDPGPQAFGGSCRECGCDAFRVNPDTLTFPQQRWTLYSWPSSDRGEAVWEVLQPGKVRASGNPTLEVVPASELDKVKAERDRIEQLAREKMVERDEARERVESLDDACRKVEAERDELRERDGILDTIQFDYGRLKAAEADNERLREGIELALSSGTYSDLTNRLISLLSSSDTTEGE